MKNEQDYENNELLLLSADYDGKSKKALLKFYDPKNDNMVKWQDESDHLPYCIVKTENIDEKTKKEILQKDGVVRIEDVTKTDLSAAVVSIEGKISSLETKVNDLDPRMVPE